MDEYFFYTKFQDWEWEDSKKEYAKLKFRTDFTEEHSEDFTIRWNLTNNTFTCNDKEICKRRDVIHVLNDPNYQKVIVEKIQKEMQQ